MININKQLSLTNLSLFHQSADDAGFETQVYNNSVCRTPNINQLAHSSVVIRHAYTSVSSCSPSRSAILTGLPQHQNGMFGLEHSPHHFRSYDDALTLPVILKPAGIKTGALSKQVADSFL